MKKEVIKVAVDANAQIDLVTKEQTGRIRELANIIIQRTAEVGKAYYDLCIEIRQKKFAPKLVSETLTGMGFAKTRISEINRVAFASDENWNEFEAKTLSFRKVLELERKTVIDVIAETGAINIKDVQHEIQRLEDGEKDEKGNQTRKAVSKKDQFENTLLKAITLAEFLNIRSRTLKMNGWTLNISKAKKIKVETVQKALTGEELGK